MKPKLIITGCARSGTLYTATVLNEAGYDVSHERRRLSDRVRKYPPSHGPSQETDIEVSWLAASFLPSEAKVVHQVRDPRKCIASMYDRKRERPSHDRKFNGWLLKQMPHIEKEGDLLEQISRYWYDWNVLIEPNADMRVRLEDLDPDVFIEMLEDFPRSRERLSSATSRVPSNTNTTTWLHKDKTELTYDDLPAYVEELGKRYGYD